jgi:hypothetical protein
MYDACEENGAYVELAATMLVRECVFVSLNKSNTARYD